LGGGKEGQRDLRFTIFDLRFEGGRKMDLRFTIGDTSAAIRINFVNCGVEACIFGVLLVVFFQNWLEISRGM